ncbi:MAG: tRNA (adenosine(37)-N6)-dimethylallyltransferase MiaA [Simkaniaceae bacterium]
MKKEKVLVISGPTACGKSDFALELARRLDGEIVSADSVQVYKGMDIGTAKATLDERIDVPHHLIDVAELFEPFNVAEYCRLAEEAIQGILSRNHVPIIVGGTGFYLHSLLYGPPKGPPSNIEVRQELERHADLHGLEPLFDHLKKLDPLYASSITSNDRNKIIRALEIIQLSNKRVSDFKVDQSLPLNMKRNFLCYFLFFPREILYPRIEMRCDLMISRGFLNEVKALMKKGLKENSSASNAIGYRQAIEYIEEGEKNFEEFVRAFKQASRRYAKRQFTWFNKEPLFKKINMNDWEMERILEMIINEFQNLI